MQGESTCVEREIHDIEFTTGWSVLPDVPAGHRGAVTGDAASSAVLTRSCGKERA